jgi:hypothetical protein
MFPVLSSRLAGFCRKRPNAFRFLRFCNKAPTGSVITSKGISPHKGEAVIHTVPHALPIIGGLVDSVVGIVTGAYYGIAGATHAVVSSVTGGRA